MAKCDIQNLENRLLLNGAPDDLTIGLPAHIREGKTFALDYTVPPRGSPMRTRIWEIDWGDGTSSLSLKPTPPAHRYSEFGVYNIFIVATDKMGDNEQSVNLLANVENIKPSPTIHCPSRAATNQPLTFTFNTGDSAPKDRLVLSWSISGIASLPYTPADEPETQSFSCTITQPGKYTLRVKVRDGDDSVGTFSKTLIVSPVALVKDSENSSLTNLIIGGTNKDDVISFENRWAGVEAIVNGVSYGIFKPTGKLIAYGGRGDDMISADSSLAYDVEFYGQSGDDVLSGASGINALVGGSGKNKLFDHSSDSDED